MANNVEDWTIITDRYVIDVGDLEIGPTTHMTRDGHHMAVHYKEDIGWLVAVCTGTY